MSNGPIVSSVSAHVLNFEHRLSVFLHEVHLVSILSVDILHLFAQVVLARIKVLRVRVRWNVGRGVAMRVGRENLCEGVTHLQLPVERSVKVSLHGVETAVLPGTLCSRRKRIIFVLIWQATLEELGVSSLRRELALLVLGDLDERLCLPQCLVLLGKALSSHAPSVSVDRTGSGN